MRSLLMRIIFCSLLAVASSQGIQHGLKLDEHKSLRIGSGLRKRNLRHEKNAIFEDEMTKAKSHKAVNELTTPKNNDEDRDLQLILPIVSIIVAIATFIYGQFFILGEIDLSNIKKEP